jgi:multidrug efflux pump subunit AcrB
MLEKIVEFFVKRHLLANFIVITVMMSGIFFWFRTNKEELPDFEMDFVRISASYPGATPDEVEYFVTKPLEDAIKGLDGILEITSTSGIGNSSIRVELEPSSQYDRIAYINDIKTAVLDVKLPDEVKDEPNIREFKSSKKSIIDIVIVDTKNIILDIESRKKLQMYALSLENQLLNLGEVSAVNRSGYLQEEIQINLIPEKLLEYNIPISKITSKIRTYNVRQPAGSLEDNAESKVTLYSPLYTIEELNNLVVQGGFEGQKIYLKDLAVISNTYEKNSSITKVNGNEAVILNVVKTSSTGILKAMDKVRTAVEQFRKNNLENTDYAIYLLNDESADVKNRLEIVSSNGIIGNASYFYGF